ncbi:metalloprotease TldD [Arsenophonus symbiont of Ornithomya chloropus]|uniref:metalloprotease TldD n=1 Tax=Arsenophonus symbiont of Ornithomya chloropus TaxID=634121 RepID=UPI0032B28AF3
MSLTIVTEHFLTSKNLNYQHLQDVLGLLTERHLDYADLFFQSIFHETLELENKIIKTGSYNIDEGVGIRVIDQDKTGFSYTNQISLETLYKSADAACSFFKKNNEKKICTLKNINFKSFYNTSNPLGLIHQEEKIEFLHRIDQLARSEDSRVKEVNIKLSGIYEHILIVATDSTLAADLRPLVCLSIRVLVEDKGKRECGVSGFGGRYDYQYFFKKKHEGEFLVEYYVKEAIRIALINLQAIAAPAGRMPVVLGSGLPGILLHEAVGHGLEGDFSRRGVSIFSNQLGTKVASELCTVVDDSTLFGHRGSLAIDDEGIPGKYNILIENGILKKYMQDKMNARLMGVPPTGNGRRESYAHLPMPRMTNTYLLEGKSMPEEIIDSVNRGIYAPTFSGGQVDITSGKFVFSTLEAYLIEKGKITKPIKGVTLIGSGRDVMQQISMVGNDLKIDSGISTCEKEGQSIPVGVGQPTLKLESMTIGGTEI